MKKTLVVVLFLFLLPLFAQNQQGAQLIVLPSQTAIGFTAPFQVAILPSALNTSSGNQAGYVPSNYTIRITVTGSPATCTYSVLGSTKLNTDNPATTDFTNGELTPDLDCTASSPIIAHVINKPWNSLIGRLKTLTGGTSPTIKLEVIAK